MGILAFRFDVDSVRCIRRGIPTLEAVADAKGVRFTFFVNMGYSFNGRVTLRHLLKRGSADPNRRSSASLPTRRKLGLVGTLETVLRNPKLGESFRGTFDRLHSAGHELALHGGDDHAIWQRELSALDAHALTELFEPAYQRFVDRYGAPRGFASPGFVHDERVLEMMDEYGFLYGSDVAATEPHHPRSHDGRPYSHLQVPVTVMGDDRVPLIEQMLAEGYGDREIVEEASHRIRSQPYALMYGHPYVEGVRADLVEKIIDAVRESHRVVTMEEYVNAWEARPDAG